MEMIRDDFVKKEELELAPGVIDEDRVRALTLNTYLVYIKEMINDGTNIFPEVVYDQIESLMMTNYMTSIYVLYNRQPDDDEISAYMNLPENQEARKSMTYLCVNANPDNWPEIEAQLKEMAPIDDLRKMSWDTKERRENAEKWRKRFKDNPIIEL